MTKGIEAASVLDLFPSRPRLLALGEPTHGEEVLLEVRNALFRQLVEQAGYRTIALESDCLGGLLVDDYVTGGAGSLGDVVREGFSHEWGAFAGNRELVRWMRERNEGCPPAEHVRFAGFDGPLEISGGASPRPVLTALHRYLADRLDADLLPCTAGTLDGLVGADERWTDPAVMFDPSRSPGQTPEAKELRLLTDDLVALLVAHAPHLQAVSSPEEQDRARLYGRTAAGLLRYHRWLADDSPRRLGALLAVRDSMMAANLLALAQRGPTFVFAHNSHLQRDPSRMRMGDQRAEWWSAGALVSAELGEQYAYLATALGTLPHHGVGTPPADTIEGRLSELPGDRLVISPAELADLLGGAPPPMRESPWFGYAPLDPAHLARIDGLVFVKDTSPPT